MSFNSYIFFLLVLSTFVAYYFVVPKRFQIHVLILANLFFYAHHAPKLLTLLLFSASMDAILSFAISRYKHKRLLATIGVCSELALLAYFKYAGLLYSTFIEGTSSSSLFSFLVNVPLPIGISFYCFQGISMLVDTYRGEVSFQRISFQKHFARTLFFVSFFPHLIAGPIVKAGEFMPQIETKLFKSIDWSTVARNLILGFFFKVVIADNLAVYTQKMTPQLFQVMASANLGALLLGYSCQIFADFCGYSMIAIGLAALFGYQFPRNFDHPYIAASFSEFWTRWHMSLSTFLRNYLYIPLGGNREGAAKTYRNLFIVMFLGGLWHGARWSYAVWGIWHGVWLMIERFAQGPRNTRSIDRKAGRKPSLASQLLRMAFVFSIVTLGWLLFRLPNFADVRLYLIALFSNRSAVVDYNTIAAIALFCIPVLLHHLLYLFPVKKTGTVFSVQILEPIFYALMAFLIFSCSGDRYEFIYFQF